MRTSQETERTQVATALNSQAQVEKMEEQDITLSSPLHEVASTRIQQNNHTPGSRHNDNLDLEMGGETENSTKTNSNSQQSHETSADPNLIEWDGPEDPGNPMNWSTAKKWRVTLAMGIMTICVTFSSSVFATATTDVARLYHVSHVTATLGTSLFVLGFGFGPLLWGPGSELFGRKYPMFLGYFCFAIFQIPVAVAQNIETIMICRFFGGLFGSSPLAVVGGALADFWGPLDRGVAACVFAASVFLGPNTGPIIGGFITMSHLGWRWTAWITLIMAAFFGIMAWFLIPESSHPVLLQQRAKRIRFETKNWAIHSKLDTVQLDFKTITQTYLVRPLVMLIQEPILILITIYMALIYGLLYLSFMAFPVSFQSARGWNEGIGALPFTGVAIGVLCGTVTIAIVTRTRFAREFHKHGHVVPEERLPPMILGAVLLPAGLFWFSWTSSPNISWVPQVLASIPIGWGILMIFLQGLNYIIDVYLWHANSALAGNTLIRCLGAAAFPLFAVHMFQELTIPWAGSLLAFLCVAMFPAPVLFYIYGGRLRKMSKFSPTM